MKTEKIKFSDLSHFSDKQKEASKLLDKYKFILYGGAMGGGKSYWLRWQLLKLLVNWAKRGHRNVIVGLFCEDYPALKDRHLSKITKEFPDWIGVFHADHKEYGKAFILNPEYGSGVIVFRNLDDPSKYQSAEFAAIAIDEITKNPKETFEDLRTRLRWPGIDDVKFLAATNPGGIGHAWVKDKFIDGKHEETEQEAHLFKYIPALAKDNPYLSPQYLISLEGLPPEKRRAYLEGDWDLFKGQYFTEWRREIHVIKPFQIPDYFNRFVCIDYGYLAPSAVYWCAIDSDGVIYVYRELYKTGLTYEQLTEEIVSSTGNEKIDYWVADPAIWAKKGDTELSGAEIMLNKYRELTKDSVMLIKGNNDRINGWNLFREYLKPFIRNSEKIAKLQVFETCIDLIRTLPALIYAIKGNPEDLDSDSEDHSADSLRYGIMSRPQIPNIVNTNPIARLLSNQINQNNNHTSYV